MVQILNRILVLLAVWCAHLSVSAQAAEGAKLSRVALVIGNSRYESAVGPLRNTGNDAKAMARALREIGFFVIEEHNVTRDQLMAALLKFRAKLNGADVALFYFAGHGISVAGSNYLLPVKSGYSPETAEGNALRLLAETKLFNAEQAVAEMSNSNAGCNLVILDACRVTPIARNPANRDATKAGGLVEMNPPAGSLIAFATDAGQVASDGDGANGLYTAELIKHLKTPGLTIEQVFKRTRAGVITASRGTQIPAEYSRLVGEDIFLAGRETEKTPEEIIPKARPIPLPTAAEIQKLAARGEIESCVEALRQHARAHSRLNVASVLDSILEQIKVQLKDTASATPRASTILRACELVVAAIPDCLTADHTQTSPLLAKAHNRRGDALMLLEKPEPALEAFNAALTLIPDDAYILYNRGSALLRLERKEEAKADFNRVMSSGSKQPGARKLAAAALAKLQ